MHQQRLKLQMSLKYVEMQEYVVSDRIVAVQMNSCHPCICLFNDKLNSCIAEQ